jgi:chaperonin cofactor prefoldin
MAKAWEMSERREIDFVLRPAVKFKFIKLIYSKPKFIFRKGTLIDIKTQFRVYEAFKEEAQKSVLIVDYNDYINPKRTEYSVIRVSEEKSKEIISYLQEAGVLKKITRSGKNIIILQPVPRLRSIDFLRKMNWKQFIEEIIDYKNAGVDPDFKIVRKATLPRGYYQSINPHAHIVLPGSTGKSEYYSTIGQLEDKVTDNSLIGYADSKGPKPGSLDKTELPIAFDQVESLTRGNILRYLFNIMEKGEAIIDNAAHPFTIWSKSTLIFLSNPIGDPKTQYSAFLEKLCKNPTIGRRFGIILYKKDAKRITSKVKDLKGELTEKIELFRAIEEYAGPEINKIIDNLWKWLNEQNEEWITQALSLIKGLENENEELATFLREFIINGGSHMRGAALNCAIVDNLDKIALKEYKIEDILRDAEKYLNELLRINFNSIETITQNYKKGIEEVQKRIFNTLPTYMKEIMSAIELWRRKLKNEEKEKIAIPYKLYLETIPYKPQTAQYFSNIIKDAKKANPSKYNDDLKINFGLEIKKEDNNIYAIIWNLTPTQTITPLGNWEEKTEKRMKKQKNLNLLARVLPLTATSK